MSPEPHGSWISVAFAAAASATTSFFAGMNGAAIALWVVTFAWALVRLRNELRGGRPQSIARKLYDRITKPADLDPPKP